MFGLTTATRDFAAAAPIDMREGFNGLFGLVRDSLAETSAQRPPVPLHQPPTDTAKQPPPIGGGTRHRRAG